MDRRIDRFAKDKLNKTLVWSQEYSVGATELDQYHMMVFNAIKHFKIGLRLKFKSYFGAALFTMLLQHSGATSGRKSGMWKTLVKPNWRCIRANIRP